MSYQVLARKWRPAKFSEVIGQSHVVQALTNAMQTGRLHHAYLFTGTRGVGKTTLGRILSKSLNCEQGPAAEPCGVCSSCVEIDEGRFVDLIEIDAASRTKVEDTREILDNVQYRPTRGRYKVYLIDEVHMLSRHSFNALLKTLEEPPPHVKFLLATTDPQKLPVTILSRCLQFNLKAMTVDQIGGQLENILQQESVPYEALAIGQLARAAQGSMRDALSLTDQAIAHGQGQLTDVSVTSMLGLLDRDHLKGLVQGLLSGSADQLMAKVSAIASFAPDYDKIIAELQSLLHRATLAAMAPSALSEQEPERDLLIQLCEQWVPEQIQLAYQILVQGRRDLSFAPDPRSGLEMTLMRILMFRPMQQTDLPKMDASFERHAPSVPAPEDLVAEAGLKPEASLTSDIAKADLGAPKKEPDGPVEISPPAEQEHSIEQPIIEPTTAEPVAVPQSQQQSDDVAPPSEFKQEPVVAERMPESPAMSGPQSATDGFDPNELMAMQEQDNTQATLEAQQDLIMSMAESQGFSPEGFVPETQADASRKVAIEQPEMMNSDAPSVAPISAQLQETESTRPSPESEQTVSVPAKPATPIDGLLQTRNKLRSQIKNIENQHRSADANAGATDVSRISAIAKQINQTDAKQPSDELPDEPADPEPERSQLSTTLEPNDIPPWEDQPLAEKANEADIAVPADVELNHSELELDAVQQEQPSSEVSDTALEGDLEPTEQIMVVPPEPYVVQKAWWEQLIDTLGFDALKRQLALDCHLNPVGDGYQLEVPVKARHLASEANINELVNKIHGYVGVNTPIEVINGAEIEAETPRQAQGRRVEERLEHAIATIQSDPVVHELTEAFDATVDHDTITPI
ncbi:DNA polymerase III subunit gamma/tau [Echinimonas agarilytica]|uniref:DNA-directed DNA polymerase n=1 Tax=Echinimonas agarilytica TaxID=1215918 RepID=A0AA41W6U3_9GAMM|nr:DNA polymerase III subunit gamma/tau [Echinimonas agarilytica]MCM2679834.1 DNA polymerase III subunit gamma/tau [Echinimonas agarilytica]